MRHGEANRLFESNQLCRSLMQLACVILSLLCVGCPISHELVVTRNPIGSDLSRTIRVACDDSTVIQITPYSARHSGYWWLTAKLDIRNRGGVPIWYSCSSVDLQFDDSLQFEPVEIYTSRNVYPDARDQIQIDAGKKERIYVYFASTDAWRDFYETQELTLNLGEIHFIGAGDTCRIGPIYAFGESGR